MKRGTLGSIANQHRRIQPLRFAWHSTAPVVAQIQQRMFSLILTSATRLNQQLYAEIFKTSQV
jgi:hypothetical protein